jgi:hypothetical protein
LLAYSVIGCLIGEPDVLGLLGGVDEEEEGTATVTEQRMAANGYKRKGVSMVASVE